KIMLLKKPSSSVRTVLIASRIASLLTGFRSWRRYQRQRRTNRSCLPFAKLTKSPASTLAGLERVMVRTLPAKDAVVTVVRLSTLAGLFMQATAEPGEPPAAGTIASGFPPGTLKVSVEPPIEVETTLSVALG